MLMGARFLSVAVLKAAPASKRYRFHSRGGVRYTYQNGQTIRQPKISLVFCANTHHKQRFAVVVSKKVLKSAVYITVNLLT